MNIYFSGIGGVGIGPLAEIARDAGYEITGSDISESLMTKQLEDQGVTVSYVQDGEFLRAQHMKKSIDWLVYTAALTPDNPELHVAKELGIRCAKRDEVLAHIIDEKNLKLIAVAGTHGKTTTTGMLIWALQQCSVPISYSIGTSISFGPSGKFDPKSEYFVYECDEFDKNFLHFSPYLSLITSIGYDHSDTYPLKQDYFDAFSQFVEQSNQTIIWEQDTHAIRVKDNTWCLWDDEMREISLAGLHNRQNAMLAIKALEYLKIPANDSVLDSFPGTYRRFEKLAPHLYSDYGHHPTEIAATLQMARELSDNVVLVYQPHQNVRQHEVREQYTDEIFSDATKIYWLPTYQSRENPEQSLLSPQELTTNISAPVHYAHTDDTLWNNIQSELQDGSLVLCMGAGSIDGWLRTKSN
jgi:UDP-N-acetylmuramate--alanine ligase